MTPGIKTQFVGNLLCVGVNAATFLFCIYFMFNTAWFFGLLAALPAWQGVSMAKDAYNNILTMIDERFERFIND